MKGNIIIFFLIFLSACSGQKNNNLMLFNGKYFKLNSGDRVNKVDEIYKNDYFNYIKTKKNQIPLYKCIENKNYKIYIGIPYNTTIAMLKQDSLLLKTNEYTYKNDSNFFYKSYNTDSICLTEYAIASSHGLIYLLAITNSPKNQDSLFNYAQLSSRIIEQ